MHVVLHTFNRLLKKRKKKKKQKEKKEKNKNVITIELITMILQEFGKGWSDRFEHKLQSLFHLLPDISLSSVQRFHGMLRVKIDALDKDVQYIVDCVVYKIERESYRVCEECGSSASFQREELLPEKRCLCWKCYALTVEKLQTKQD